MEFKYGELNKDFYEVQTYSVGQSVEIDTFKISQKTMKHFVSELSKYIHSKCDHDIYICDDDIINLDVKKLFYFPYSKFNFKIGLDVSDSDTEFEVKDYGIVSAIPLMESADNVSISVNNVNNGNFRYRIMSKG